AIVPCRLTLVASLGKCRAVRRGERALQDLVDGAPCPAAGMLCGGHIGYVSRRAPATSSGISSGFSFGRHSLSSTTDPRACGPYVRLRHEMFSGGGLERGELGAHPPSCVESRPDESPSLVGIM